MIDWKSKIEEKYLYTKTDKYKNTPIKDVPEGDLLLKLGGVQELARLRGFESVEFRMTHVEHDYVSAVCRIVWAEEIVDGVTLRRQVYESTASAKASDVGPKMSQYLETVAENRAFVRCVRRYLGVNIVGEDEINKGYVAKQAATLTEAPEKEHLQTKKMPTASDVLVTVCKKRKMDIEELKALADKYASESKINIEKKVIWEWKSIGEIEPQNARKLSGIIQVDIPISE